VNNDTGSATFSFTFNGSLVNNQFLDCQENGGFAGDSCSITGALGTVGTDKQYGPPTPGIGPNWNPNATITLVGPASGNFDITFQSFGNGASGSTGPVSPVPEPSTLVLFGSGILGLLGFAALRRL
jgi:PEP-CTERM motif